MLWMQSFHFLDEIILLVSYNQPAIDWYVNAAFTLFLIKFSSVGYKTDVFEFETKHCTMYK